MSDLIISKYLNKINQSKLLLEEKHNHIYDNNLLVCYRGEKEDFGNTSLMPSIFRGNRLVEKEMHLFELMCDYGITDSKASSIEKAIESQHYIAISRMLDISFTVLTALYFSLGVEHPHEDVNSNKDGVFYVFAFPNNYSPNSKFITEYYDNLLHKKFMPYSKNFKVMSHSYSNDRIMAQKGGFIFFPGDTFQAIDNCYYEKIIVDKRDKRKLQYELKAFFNMNFSSIFPEKQNIAVSIKEKFADKDYKIERTSLRNEIEFYFNKLEYELNFTKKTDTQLGRYLRKEKCDLIHYLEEIYKLSDDLDHRSVDCSISSKEYLKELCQLISNRFISIEISNRLL